MALAGTFAAAFGLSETAVAALLALGAVVLLALGVVMLMRPKWRIVGACGVFAAVTLSGVATYVFAEMADRQAYEERAARLAAPAFAPGSPLACLDGLAGDVVAAACEKAVFGSPATVGAGVAYLAAQYDLVRDATARSGTAGLSSARRMIEADRFGMASYMLQARAGCDASKCNALAMFADGSRIKANLASRTFENYIARYALAWGVPAATMPPVAEGAAASFATASAAIDHEAGRAAGPAGTGAPAAAPQPQVAMPLSSKYDFPSASSIPPISIMTPEPGPGGKSEAKSETKPEASPAAGAPPAAQAATPLPPRRPTPAVRSAAAVRPAAAQPRQAPADTDARDGDAEEAAATALPGQQQ